MNNLQNIIFYTPATFKDFISTSITIAVLLMVVSLFSEKFTSTTTKVTFFVLPLITLFFYILQFFKIYDLEKTNFNTILVFIIFIPSVYIFDILVNKIKKGY
jgi:hypothetical protein